MANGKRNWIGILAGWVLIAGMSGCNSFEMKGSMEVFEDGYFRVGRSLWHDDETSMAASVYGAELKLERSSKGKDRFDLILNFPSQRILSFSPIYGVRCRQRSETNLVCSGRKQKAEERADERIRYVACFEDEELYGFEIWRLNPRAGGNARHIARMGRSCDWIPLR